MSLSSTFPIILAAQEFGFSGGLLVSSWTLNEEQSRPLIRQAIELGINFFDTANSYSDGTSEEIVGRALKDFARREEIIVATKVYFPMREGRNARSLSRKAIMSPLPVKNFAPLPSIVPGPSTVTFSAFAAEIITTLPLLGGTPLPAL